MRVSTNYVYFSDSEIKGCVVRHDLDADRWEAYNYDSKQWKWYGFDGNYQNLDENCRNVGEAEAFAIIKRNTVS